MRRNRPSLLPRTPRTLRADLLLFLLLRKRYVPSQRRLPREHQEGTHLANDRPTTDLATPDADASATAGASADRPAVSVLMPAYNDAPFVGKAIDSILAQSFMDFEFIIVDDGSTDDTGDVIARKAERDKRIRVVTNERNLGIVAALNRGLDACRGRYVARMDADDIALPDRLAMQVARMDEAPDVVALGGSLEYIDATGADMDVRRDCAVDESPLAANPMLHPTVVIRREVLDKHRLRYDERFRYAEDYFLWLRISRLGRLDSIDNVVLKYRISAGASRMKHLKAMLWATIRTKLAGIFRLGIRPRVSDVLRLAAELVLLAVPAGIVRRLYLRRTFGPSASKRL